MAKKEKNIEVNVKDTYRDNQAVQQVYIHNKLVGEVTTDGNRFKAVLFSGPQEFIVRSQEEGLETIIQQYHLHQN